MALTPGTRIGSYEITAQIGVGGMGEVYRATDTKLKRQVAIKVLPEAVAADADRLARFQREAEVLASLNHPNIAAIHGLEDAGDSNALVMELVEGPTLADRIEEGPLPVDEALAIARQIAEALEAAHEQGIIHRDLKPANVKVRPDGAVKVLDFGLAKAVEPVVASAADQSLSPTITTPAMTQAGLILGTAAYMSPEQAKGRLADRRSDVWAFGAVLYEMLTGRRAFDGDDLSTTLARVIEREPDWSQLPRTVTPRLRELLERCLTKDVRARKQSIGDVRLDLERANRVDGSGSGTVAGVGAWRRRAPWAVAAGLAAGLVWLLLQPAGSTDRPTRAAVEVVMPEGVHLAVDTGHPTIALSPDGSRLILVGEDDGVRRLYRRDLADPDFGVVAIEGTERASSPFFSADGEQVAFFREASGLSVVSPGSGVPAEVTFATDSSVNRGGAWLDSRTFVYAASANEALQSLDVANASMARFAWTSIDGVPRPSAWPFALPGGRKFLLTNQATGAATPGVGVFSLDTREVVPVVNGGTNPRYASTGHVLYARGGSLYAVPYDAGTDEVRQERLLVEGVEMGDTGAAQFAVAGRTLAYISGDLTPVDHELVWVDQTGSVVDVIRDDDHRFNDPRLSPDGSQIAFRTLTGPNLDNLEIFVHSLTRGDLQPLTSDPGEDFSPVWHPTAGLAFATEVGEADGEVEVGPALGWMAGPNARTELLLRRPGSGMLEMPTSWSRDGRWLAFTASTGLNQDIHVLDFEAKTPEPFIASPEFRESAPAFSPDGNWIAYVSDRSGQEEIYLAPFPGGADPRRVSTDGGVEPVWSRNGRELFFRNRSHLMWVTFSGGEGNPDVPRQLFADAFERTTLGAGQPNYDVSLDGQRFVMVRRKNPVTPTRIRVVLDWPQVFGIEAP